MLADSLLGNGHAKANGAGPGSFDTSDSYGGDTAAHPLETSRLKQRKVLPAWAYYGLIAAATLSSLLFLIVLIAWASSHPKVETVYVNLFPSSTAAAAPTSPPIASTAADSSTAVPPIAPTSAVAPIAPTSQPMMPTSAMTPYPNNLTDAPNILLPKYPTYSASSWPGQVKTWNLLHHLSGIYSVAMENGGNRVINQPGFNASIEYLLRAIRTYTNLVNVERTYFSYATSVTVTSSSFTADIEGVSGTVRYAYGTDWRIPINSRPADGTIATVVLVPNGGCAQSDYDDALGPEPPYPLYVIVRQTANCTDANRIGFAQYVEATGLLIVWPTNTLPTNLRAPWVTQISVAYMSSTTGQKMIDAIAFGGTAAVTLNLAFNSTQNDVVISNICGDTPVGDPTSVVVVGGHSDGVARGPGTNDDGSGSVSTLILAMALTKLMANTTVKYQPVNMVKFCWFGGEESGLLGSAEVVRTGVDADRDPKARVGTKARDWAIMVDLDMLGSLNFQNWVYDANSYIPPTTPVRAHSGSKLLSNLFFEYFDQNNLPRDSERFDGRSDYGPFLVAGVPAGGVYAGADKTKTEALRQRYQQMTGWGGVAGQINDQCYHQVCDSIANIHWGVYTNQTQSAAYVMEKLALRSDLRQWLGNPLLAEGEEPAKGPLDHLHFDFRYGPLPRTAEELQALEALDELAARAERSPSSELISFQQQPPPPPNNPTDAPNILLPKYPTYPINSWPGQVKTWNLLHHLSGIFSVAMENGANRVITAPGFNASVEYLLRAIAQHTNLVNVERTYFPRATNYTVTSSYFGAQIEGIKGTVNYTYNVDWRVSSNSKAGTGETAAVLYVANGGCAQSDYDDALGPTPPYPFYLIVRQTTNCSNNNRIGFAQYVQASGLIVQGPTLALPNAGTAPLITTIPVVVMNNRTAQVIIDSILFGGTSAVTLNLWFTYIQTDVIISNICGDSPAGDPTSVVVVGGHSDGVARGPGTNDDGSGSVSTLILAMALTKLMANTTVKYQPVNMVKFCWFGGEESGLLGSNEVVRVGLEKDRDPQARPGSRARDWAVMVDLDMLGSLNFQNWVYDANTFIPPTTPVRAHNGSRLLSNLFFEYFDQNNLPRDSDTFDGRSDYGPFLVAGIPAGGVDAGADKTKTEDTRARYQQMTGWGGWAGKIMDQCYHQACDTIENIHWGVYTNMTQSSAYVMEKLALRSDLRQWLGNPLLAEGEEPAKGPVDHLPFDFRWGPRPWSAEEIAEREALGLDL